MTIVRNSMVINNCKKKIAFRAETNKNNMKVIKNSTMILQEQNQNLLHLMMTQKMMWLYIMNRRSMGINKIKKKIAFKAGSNKKNMKVTKTSILKLK